MPNPFSTNKSQPLQGVIASDVEPVKTAMEQAKGIQANNQAALQLKKMEASDNFLSKLEQLNSLDWDKLPVPILAKLLMSKPIKQGKDEPDYYFTPEQALIYASSINFLNVGCSRPELKLNPFLNDVWIDVKTMKINVTVEGQRKIAARRGDLGIAKWTVDQRPFPPGTVKPFPWMTEDIGMKCSIPISTPQGDVEAVEAIAWISRWYKPTPIWKDNWEHMLKVRSEGLCYEVITGVGISSDHSDKEIEKVPELSASVAATAFKPAEE